MAHFGEADESPDKLKFYFQYNKVLHLLCVCCWLGGAVALAFLILGERVSWQIILGGTLIVAGSLVML